MSPAPCSILEPALAIITHGSTLEPGAGRLPAYAGRSLQADWERHRRPADVRALGEQPKWCARNSVGTSRTPSEHAHRSSPIVPWRKLPAAPPDRARGGHRCRRQVGRARRGLARTRWSVDTQLIGLQVRRRGATQRAQRVKKARPPLTRSIVRRLVALVAFQVRCGPDKLPTPGRELLAERRAPSPI